MAPHMACPHHPSHRTDQAYSFAPLALCRDRASHDRHEGERRGSPAQTTCTWHVGSPGRGARNARGWPDTCHRALEVSTTDNHRRSCAQHTNSAGYAATKAGKDGRRAFSTERRAQRNQGLLCERTAEKRRAGKNGCGELTG
eukprot:3490864-Rhodomonas_salina.2